MLMAAMVGLDARSTMDLDATVKGATVNVEDVEASYPLFYRFRWRTAWNFKSNGSPRLWRKQIIRGVRVSMETHL